jgi:hypothetical protein
MTAHVSIFLYFIMPTVSSSTAVTTYRYIKFSNALLFTTQWLSYIPPTSLNFSTFRTPCNHVLHLTLAITSDCSRQLHQPVGLRSGNAARLL